MTKVKWSQKVFHAYPAHLLAQTFKWSIFGIILLNITVQEHRVKGIHDPGCVRIAFSHAWAN